MERNWLLFIVKHNLILSPRAVDYIILYALVWLQRITVRQSLHFSCYLQFGNSKKKMENRRKQSIHSCVYTIWFHLCIYYTVFLEEGGGSRREGKM